MYRHDYVIRLIEQFGHTLRALVGRILRREATSVEVRSQIAEIARLSGLPLDVARGLDPGMLLMWLAPTGEADPGKFWLMAELLFIEGLHRHQEGDRAGARGDLERARLILSRIDTDFRPEPDLVSAGERLADIRQRLGRDR
jgi:hypothetical protein